MITVGSLFSGIGGLDLGLERANMKILWQVEIDDYCNRVLEKHWPNVRRYKDVKECGKHNLEKVDLVCGGFPCQPVSNAGKRRGTQDKRWLWPEFNRIICEIQPRWVIIENVPGLLSIDDGRLFSGILRELSEAGYDAEWFTLRASDFGAPHKRERVFVIAHNNGLRKGQSLNVVGREISPFAARNGKEVIVAHAEYDGNRTQRLNDNEERKKETQKPECEVSRPRPMPIGCCKDVSDTASERLEGHGRECGLSESSEKGKVIGNGDVVRRWKEWWAIDPADFPITTRGREDGRCGNVRGNGEFSINSETKHTGEREESDDSRKGWTVKSFVGRVANGIPNRVDRLKGLGNAVVPQVAECIGRLIVAYDETHDTQISP